MRMMDQPIHDRIAKRDVAHAFVPAFDGHLAGEQRGATARAVFDHLQQIPPLAIPNRREAQVIDDQEIRFPELREHFAVRAVAARHHEVGQEAWQAQIAQKVAMATRTVSKRTREPRLAGSRRPRNQ